MPEHFITRVLRVPAFVLSRLGPALPALLFGGFAPAANAQAESVTFTVPYQIHGLPAEFRTYQIECALFNASGQARASGSASVPVPAGGDTGTRFATIKIELPAGLPRSALVRYRCDFATLRYKPIPYDRSKSQVSVEGQIPF